MYTLSTGLVRFIDLFKLWNVRLSDDGTALMPSIRTNGIQTPLWVNADHEGPKVPTIRGHRRGDALGRLFEEGTVNLTEAETTVWNQLFGDGEGCGIPVTFVHGASPQELAQLHIDQDSVALKTMTECAFVCRALYDRGGMVGADVAQHMAGILDTISPPKGKKAVEIEKAKSAKDLKKARTLYAEYRHGTIQYLKRLADGPDCILWALQKQETDTVPDECDLEAFPKVTRASVTLLEKALQADVMVRLDDGSAPYSRKIPGPAFKAAWEKQIQDATESDESSEKRAKAMSAKDMQEQAGKWTSQGFKGLCEQHAGGTSNCSLEDADELLWLAEYVRSTPEWLELAKQARALALAATEKADEEVAALTLAKAQADGEKAAKPAKKKAKKPEKAPVAVAN